MRHFHILWTIGVERRFGLADLACLACETCTLGTVRSPVAMGAILGRATHGLWLLSVMGIVAGASVIDRHGVRPAQR